MKDLFILCADSDMKSVLESLIKRLTERQKIREISYEIIRAYGRDSGVYKKAHELVRGKDSEYEKCLVLFDYKGSGARKPVADTEDEVKNNIIRNSNYSQDDVEVIVIDPELEIWIWKGWIHFHRLSERTERRKIIEWLREHEVPNSYKPDEPKDLFEKFCRHFRVKKSSANYRRISEKTSLRGCTDRAFNKFMNALTRWFCPCNNGETTL